MTETEFRLTVNGAERSVTCERVARAIQDS
jgi:hypothetical protein